MKYERIGNAIIKDEWPTTRKRGKHNEPIHNQHP
jgi:hypothetical protein